MVKKHSIFKFSSLLITNELNDWSVWIGLPGEDPVKSTFGFAVGTGRTRDLAVADAVRDLEDCIGRLQAPAGVVPERAE